ncbi:hypothetical protein Pcinc_011358 [Petrolisthes cinctipes]|uniref:Secreted protein n=1 Tax=Petrolisthes cinctipes TaxID=88211 RepID=A0AAE1KUH0_PETCI|nr:hypothetical protein Pcinc_011358 [Petrolisthes cinctipes]
MCGFSALSQLCVLAVISKMMRQCIWKEPGGNCNQLTPALLIYSHDGDVKKSQDRQQQMIGNKERLEFITKEK